MGFFNTSLPTIDPMLFPHEYFHNYEIMDGMDCIFIYYNDPACSMRYDRNIEIRTDLARGMEPGFYRIGFDYALKVGEKIKWLSYAHKARGKREYGVFGSFTGFDNIRNRDLLWVQ